jgi:hypothetical protein
MHRGLILYSVIFLSLACAGTKASAQGWYEEENKVTFRGGLIGGLNFTQVDGDSYSGYHKVGINAGPTVYVHFTKMFGVSLEMLFSQKGSRSATVTESPYVGTYIQQYTMKLNYVEIPLLLHLVDRRLDFEAGGSWARIISTKEYAIADYPVIIDPVLNRFNTQDIEWIVGGSVKLNKHWYANARYQYSFIAIRPEDRVPVGFNYGSKGQFNNLCVLRLEYYIN